MFLTSVRYRMPTQDTWTFLRFPTGHGSIKNVQIIPKDIFENIKDVLSFALSDLNNGQQLLEVVIQLHDFDGCSWSIMRKPGTIRITKDGEPVDTGQALNELVNKAIGEFGTSQNIAKKQLLFHVREAIFENNRLESWTYGQPQPGQLAFRRILGEKIEEIKSQICLRLGCDTQKGLQNILGFSDHVASLHARIEFMTQWLAMRIWKSDSNSTPEVSTLQDNHVSAIKSAKELGIMAEIHRLVTPLVGPGVVPLQTLKKHRMQLDQQIQSLENLIGHPCLEGDLPDFDLALEVLSRFKSFNKILKSTQNLREYCDNNLDPKLKAYIENAENIGSDFRRVLEEIQAEQLLIQQQKEIFIPKEEAHFAQGEEQESRALGAKNWFDRFKNPIKSSQATTENIQAQREKDQLWAFVRKVSQSIDTVVNKGVQILEDLPDVDLKHRDLSTALDESLNAIGQKYVHSREEWEKTAKKFHLSLDMDISNLVKLSVVYSRLTIMKEQRQWVDSKISDYLDRVQKLEKLIIQWRKLTDSQKLDPLDHPQLVIQESISITRYMDSKIKRFDQLKEKFSDQNLKNQSMHFMRDIFEEEHKELLKKWREAFHEFGTSVIPPENPKITELIHTVTKLKSLLEIQESMRPSGEEARQPALVELMTFSQRFAEESINPFMEWVRSESEMRSPYRTLFISTDQEVLIKQMVAHGASLGVLTTRTPPLAAGGVSQVSKASLPTSVTGGKGLGIGLQEPPTSGASGRGEHPSIHAKPTPTLRKGPPPQPSQGDHSSRASQNGDSLQVRAERVLAMLSPRDTSKLSR